MRGLRPIGIALVRVALCHRGAASLALRLAAARRSSIWQQCAKNASRRSLASAAAAAAFGLEVRGESLARLAARDIIPEIVGSMRIAPPQLCQKTVRCEKYRA